MDLPTNILPAAWGPISLEPALAPAKIGERRLILTPTELKLLYALVRAKGVTVTYDDLVKSVLGMKYDGWRDNLRVIVCRLRKKLPEVSIVNDRWQGYHIELKREVSNEHERGTRTNRPAANRAG